MRLEDREPRPATVPQRLRAVQQALHAQPRSLPYGAEHVAFVTALLENAAAAFELEAPVPDTEYAGMLRDHLAWQRRHVAAAVQAGRWGEVDFSMRCLALVGQVLRHLDIFTTAWDSGDCSGVPGAFLYVPEAV